MLVITVAPHRLICPMTRQYPRKAVRIMNTSRITPTDHGAIRGLLYEP
jgi:hypothetical protein